MLNTKRLTLLADAVEQTLDAAGRAVLPPIGDYPAPTRIDLTSWYRIDARTSPDSACGCALALAMFVPEFQAEGFGMVCAVRKNPDPFDGMTVFYPVYQNAAGIGGAMRFFGLTPDQAVSLFSGERGRFEGKPVDLYAPYVKPVTGRELVIRMREMIAAELQRAELAESHLREITRAVLAGVERRSTIVHTPTFLRSSQPVKVVDMPPGSADDISWRCAIVVDVGAPPIVSG